MQEGSELEEIRSYHCVVNSTLNTRRHCEAAKHVIEPGARSINSYVVSAGILESSGPVVRFKLLKAGLEN